MDSLEQELTGIERSLWRNDAVVYREALIEEAILVFAETGVITRETAVQAILEENAAKRRWAEVEFLDARVLRLNEDAALLSYRASARWEHEANRISALASSVYVRRGGSWKLAFHQQTSLGGVRP